MVSGLNVLEMSSLLSELGITVHPEKKRENPRESRKKAAGGILSKDCLEYIIDFILDF
jgi:hypothetical protein